MNAKAATTTTAGTSVSGPFDPSGEITYTAKVTPPPSTGYVSALAALNRGTVAFNVDGTAIADCAAKPVNGTTGEATCTTTAPASGADHTLKTTYTGGTFYVGSEGEAAFKLKVGGVSEPPTPDSGSGAAAPVPPPTGAVFAPGRSTTLAFKGNSVTVPVRCPDEQACSVEGTVTVTTGTTARAAAAGTATVARFSRVRIVGGKVRKLKLRLDPAFVRKARKQGIRRVRATLMLNTTLGSGAKVTTTQRITIVLPKARKKQAKPRFTGL